MKPEFFHHELLYRLEMLHGGGGSGNSSFPLRLFYIGLWTCCDREGRFEWKPSALRNHILPYDSGGVDLVVRLLDVLRSRGFVAHYAVGDRQYGWVIRFTTHQVINNRERASEIPPPPADLVRAIETAALAVSFNMPSAESLVTLPVEAPILDASATRDSRVEHASGTREPRVEHATRLNGTELNGTELNGGQESLSTSSTGDEHERSSKRSASERADVAPAASGVSTSDSAGSPPDAPTGLVLAQSASTGVAQRSKPGTVAPRTVTAIVETLAGHLADVRANAEKRLSAEKMRSLQASLVFAYWAEVTGRAQRTVLDPKRERTIIARLKENGANVHELLYAVDGAKSDRHLQGDNDRERKYDGIETIFRDRAIVERLAESRKAYRDGKPHPMAVKYLASSGEAGA